MTVASRWRSIRGDSSGPLTSGGKRSISAIGTIVTGNVAQAAFAILARSSSTTSTEIPASRSCHAVSSAVWRQLSGTKGTDMRVAA
jgi:hypothetical protein